MRCRMEELKNKILQAMQSDFIGDVQFDEDEIAQMKENCKKFYRAAQNTWSKYYKIRIPLDDKGIAYTCR